jgi:hypothetical protein
MTKMIFIQMEKTGIRYYKEDSLKEAIKELNEYIDSWVTIKPTTKKLILFKIKQIFGEDTK